MLFAAASLAESITLKTGQFLAGEIIGKRVYNIDHADISVRNIVVTLEGSVVGYVIDVNGFLGMAVKKIFLPSTSIQIVPDKGNSFRIRTQLTMDELAQASEFKDR
jgi:hypothetical protein